MGEPVRVIVTGGTIDEDRPDTKTGRSLFVRTHMPAMLKEAGIAKGIHIDDLMMKDSSDITDQDRQQILDRCRSCPEKRIVITHGTNTMVETAAVLGKNILDKTVVLVGAFVPYVQERSDAVPNLRYAFSTVQQLVPGVYIAMNGKIFTWNNVRKNRVKEIFEDLEQPAT